MDTRNLARLAVVVGILPVAFSAGAQECTHLYTLSDLLEQIQLYNSHGYHCDSDSDSGYAPGFDGDRTCPAIWSDYNPSDFVITLSELLRQIQFYNVDTFHFCPSKITEDGYCPGNDDGTNGCEPIQDPIS